MKKITLISFIGSELLGQLGACLKSSIVDSLKDFNVQLLGRIAVKWESHQDEGIC